MTRIPITDGQPPQPPDLPAETHLDPDLNVGDRELALHQATSGLVEQHDRLNWLLKERPDLIKRVVDLQTSQLRGARERRRTDPLTELGNQVAFNADLATELNRGSGCALAVLDLDRFKVVNDVLGHESGNQVLISASRAITDTIRTTDKAYRWGGDEFVVIMPRFNDPKEPHKFDEVLEDRKTSLQQAITTAIRSKAIELGFPKDDPRLEEFGTTIAYGTPQPDETSAQFFERVDSQLIKQKEERNSSAQSGFIPMIVVLVMLILLFIGLALWRVLQTS